MFDDGKAEAGAALRPRPVWVDTVETFGQADEVVGGDANAVVGDFELDRVLFEGLVESGPGDGDGDALFGRPVFDRVLDEVVEDLLQLRVVAGDGGDIARDVGVERGARVGR